MRRPRVAVVVSLARRRGARRWGVQQGRRSSTPATAPNPKDGEVFLDPSTRSGRARSRQRRAGARSRDHERRCRRRLVDERLALGRRHVAPVSTAVRGRSRPATRPPASTRSSTTTTKAQAWVDALNDDAISPGAAARSSRSTTSPTYVGELTSVIVQSDTRVTDHVFSGGERQAFQAVLQRGTAVMIDKHGHAAHALRVVRPAHSRRRPRVHRSTAAPSGTGFDKTKLVVVTPGSREADTFRLVDIHTHKSIEVFAGQSCICDRTTQGSTTTTTTEFFDEDTTTSTTSKTGRTTTTVKRPTSTTGHVRRQPSPPPQRRRHPPRRHRQRPRR